MFSRQSRGKRRKAAENLEFFAVGLQSPLRGVQSVLAFGDAPTNWETRETVFPPRASPKIKER